jgi:hypothetical protein
MPFTPERKHKLLMEIATIYQPMLSRLSTYDPVHARDTLLTKVYEAHLTNDPEELFWLGYSVFFRTHQSKRFTILNNPNLNTFLFSGKKPVFFE